MAFKGSSLLCHALLKQLNLPSEEQNKVHPCKEQGQSSNFLLESQLTVTWWNNVEERKAITNQLQIVGERSKVSHSLKQL